jgi:hypothetical protein
MASSTLINRMLNTSQTELDVRSEILTSRRPPIANSSSGRLRNIEYIGAPGRWHGTTYEIIGLHRNSTRRWKAMVE